MPVDFVTMRRLAYIRYLHQLGIEQARLPQPLSSASILVLHDAVETFLLLAAEHFEVVPPTQFEKYWDILGPRVAGNSGLAVMQGMRRLNRVRVALKHHGAHPDVPTIEQAVVDTTTFMTANTQIVFGLDYDTVSMAHVISQELARGLVEKAEVARAGDDYVTAMMRLVEAFDVLFDQHQPKNSWSKGSPFSFGPRLGWRRFSTDKIVALIRPRRESGDLDHHDVRDLAEQISNVTAIVAELQPAMRLTALGIEYAMYERFRRLTPVPTRLTIGPLRWRAPKGYAPTRDEYSFCLQFIVTASLRLAAAEAHLTDPNWLTRDQWGRTEWEDIEENEHGQDGEAGQVVSP